MRHQFPNFLYLLFLSTAKEVVLTDGDPANVEQIRKTLYHNTFSTKLITASLLHWDGYASANLEGRFDQVIAADVVYDSGVFDSLIKTVSKVFKNVLNNLISSGINRKI